MVEGPGPTGMTFDSLVQDVKDTLERGNVTDTTVLRQIPRVINRAERSIADRLKIQGYRDVFTGSLSLSAPTLAKPDGWRNTVSLSIGLGVSGNDRRVLRNRSYEYLRALYPNDTLKDAPVFYADYDQLHWLFAPTPDIAYPFEAIVYRLPDLLGPANQQNYLTRFVPNFLLYSTLIGMEAFMRNDTRIPTWKMLCEDEFNGISAQDQMKIADRAQTRNTS